MPPELTKEEKTEKEGLKRNAAIQWNSLQMYIRSPVALQNPERRKEAVKMVKFIQENAPELIEDFLGKMRLMPIQPKVTQTDRLFCVMMMAASTEEERQLVMGEWAVKRLGKIPKKGLTKIGVYDEQRYLHANRLESKGLENLYARIVVKKEVFDFLHKDLGINRFLRYPPEVLLSTYNYYKGKTKSGNVCSIFGTTRDHNGSLYNNYLDLKKAAESGYTVVVHEWNDEQEFLKRLGDFITISKKGSFTMDTFILAGHGSIKKVGEIDVTDTELFSEMKKLLSGVKYKQLFIFSCEAAAESQTPDFVNIATTLHHINFAEKTYAPKKETTPRFHPTMTLNLVPTDRAGKRLHLVN